MQHAGASGLSAARAAFKCLISAAPETLVFTVTASVPSYAGKWMVNASYKWESHIRRQETSRRDASLLMTPHSTCHHSQTFLCKRTCKRCVGKEEEAPSLPPAQNNLLQNNLRNITCSRGREGGKRVWTPAFSLCAADGAVSSHNGINNQYIKQHRIPRVVWIWQHADAAWREQRVGTTSSVSHTDGPHNYLCNSCAIPGHLTVLAESGNKTEVVHYLSKYGSFRGRLGGKLQAVGGGGLINQKAVWAYAGWT